MRFPLSTLTAVFAVYAVVVLVALLLVGRPTDAVGRKSVLLLAGLLSALA